MTSQIIILIVGIGYYLLPAYAANMAPVLLQRTLKRMATPIDMGKKFKGKPILGSHKTWRGVFAATLLGSIVFFVQKLVAGMGLAETFSLFSYTEISPLFGLFMGFGSIFGDSLKSFFKRRVGIGPGKPWIPFDQTDFVFGGIFFTLPFFVPSLQVFILALLLSVLLHMTANHIVYYLGIRKVKW